MNLRLSLIITFVVALLAGGMAWFAARKASTGAANSIASNIEPAIDNERFKTAVASALTMTAQNSLSTSQRGELADASFRAVKAFTSTSSAELTNWYGELGLRVPAQYEDSEVGRNRWLHDTSLLRSARLDAKNVTCRRLALPSGRRDGDFANEVSSELREPGTSGVDATIGEFFEVIVPGSFGVGTSAFSGKFVVRFGRGAAGGKWTPTRIGLLDWTPGQALPFPRM